MIDVTYADYQCETSSLKCVQGSWLVCPTAAGIIQNKLSQTHNTLGAESRSGFDLIKCNSLPGWVVCNVGCEVNLCEVKPENTETLDTL